MQQGDRVRVCGDSAALWISGYNVRVSTEATVLATPSKQAKKVLLALDNIDGDANVCCFVRRNLVEQMNQYTFQQGRDR